MKEESREKAIEGEEEEDDASLAQVEPLLWALSAVDDETEKICAAVRKLYQSVAGLDGHLISQRQQLFRQNKDLAYGEILCLPFAEVLQKVAPPTEFTHTFYDLGSGNGKAVMLAAALYRWKKAWGIELIPELHQASTEALSLALSCSSCSFSSSSASASASSSCSSSSCCCDSLHLRTKQVGFTPADFLLPPNKEETSCWWTDGDVIYACCATWSEELLSAVGRKAASLRCGSRFITVGQPLPSSFVLSSSSAFVASPRRHEEGAEQEERYRCWRLTEKLLCDHSWSSAQVYLYFKHR